MNRKLFISLGMVIIVVGTAAFVAGRLLSRGVSPLDLFGPMPDDGISILPAAELPTTPPEAEGLFAGRQDNIIIVEADQRIDSVSGSPVGIGGGPKSEVVVTAETIIYRDTTQPPARRPSGDDPRVIQQTVEDGGTLDDLINSQSLVLVWGRRSGDRVIAEVMVYSNPTYLEIP